MKFLTCELGLNVTRIFFSLCTKYLSANILKNEFCIHWHHNSLAVFKQLSATLRTAVGKTIIIMQVVL